jgi:hypothetical protein
MTADPTFPGLAPRIAAQALNPGDVPTIAPPVMPHPNEDPDHLAARQARQNYTDQAAAARADFDHTDLWKAQQISAAYDTYVTAVAAAYQRITLRRRSRLEHLESLVPVGPGIPDGTSPADKAVLMTAFRTALATVKDARGRTARAALLAEAETYDDDAMRRAVLTYALDSGEIDTVKAWAELHLDVAGYFDEIAQLRAALAGRTGGWDFKDFTPMPKPAEARQLPALERSAANTAAARAAYGPRPAGYYNP